MVGAGVATHRHLIVAAATAAEGVPVVEFLGDLTFAVHIRYFFKIVLLIIQS